MANGFSSLQKRSQSSSSKFRLLAGKVLVHLSVELIFILEVCLSGDHSESSLPPKLTNRRLASTCHMSPPLPSCASA